MMDLTLASMLRAHLMVIDIFFLCLIKSVMDAFTDQAHMETARIDKVGTHIYQHATYMHWA